MMQPSLVSQITKVLSQSPRGEHVDRVGALNILRKQKSGFLRRYSVVKMLASGAGGVTFLATDRATGLQVVVKRPKNIADTTDFDALVAKKHPNIVRVFECFHNERETQIVMEYFAGGDLSGALHDMVRTHGKPTTKWCAAVFQQTLRGVLYLHDHFHQSHNDLKPENILLDRRPANRNDVPRVAVADFGCAGASYSITGGDRWGVGGSWVGATGGGDLRYRAPETFRGKPFSAATDAWSLGVTLYELVTGGLLIYTHQQNVSGWGAFCALQNGRMWQNFLAILKSGMAVDLAWLPAEIGQAKQVLAGLLRTDPEKRMSLHAALEHTWFNQLGNTEQDQLPVGEEVAGLLRTRTEGSSIRLALLNLIGSQLQGQSLNYYRALWEQYDKDGDGVMTFEEFSSMMKDHGVKQPEEDASPFRFFWSASPSYQDIFAMGDVDGSGAIDFQEFVGLMFNANELREEEKLQYFKSAFRILTGPKEKMSTEDLAGLFPNYRGDPEAIDTLFRQIDADGDGVIDYDEFAQFVDSL